MAVMKLNEVEIEGIKQKFQDGVSLEKLQEIMPNNKKNLIAELYDSLEHTQDVEKTWESVFEETVARLVSGGIPEGKAYSMIEKAKNDIDLGEHVPDTDTLYIHCISNYNKQDLMKLRSESGKQQIHAMNMAASSNKTPKAKPNSPLEANIFKPNG